MKKVEMIIVVASVLFVFSLSSATYALNATRTDALNAINQSEQDMQEMIAAGFAVNSINDSITAANLALQRADFAELLRNNATGELAQTAKKALEGLNYEGFTYDDVLKYTSDVATRKLRAYNTLDSLAALEIKISEYKKTVDVNDVEKIFENAKTAFNYERYDEAESLVAQANDLLDSKRAQLATLNVLVISGKSFVEKNWKGTILFGVIISVFGYLAWRIYETSNIEKRLRKLRAERESLIKLMKEAQRERYEKQSLSALVYNIRMEKYNKRLNEIKEIVPVLQAELQRKKLQIKISESKIKRRKK